MTNTQEYRQFISIFENLSDAALIGLLDIEEAPQDFLDNIAYAESQKYNH